MGVLGGQNAIDYIFNRSKGSDLSGIMGKAILAETSFKEFSHGAWIDLTYLPSL